MSQLQTDAEIENYKYFRKTLWTTKGCLFQAHKRLNEKDKASNFTLSILSIYVIIVSLISITSENVKNNNLDIIAIIASILILVLSNIEYSKSYSMQAEKMFRCAQEISELYYDFANLIKTKK